MADRTVTYRLQVIADKSIPSTFKTFEKQALAVRDRIDKRTKQSGDATAKTAKTTADAEEREARRVGKVVERMLAHRERIVARAVTQEIQQGKRIAASMLADMERVERAKERQTNKMMALRQRELTDSLRATDKEAAARQRAFAAMDRDRERMANRAVASANRVAQANARMFGGSTAMGGAFRGMAQMAAGYMSIHYAISKITESIRVYERILQSARDKTMDLEEAMGTAFLMAGTPEGRAQMQREIPQMATRLRLGEEGTKGLYSAAAYGASATGGNIPATLSAMEAAATLAPFSQQLIRDLTAGLLDIRKVTGSDDAKENLGFLLMLTRQARATDPSVVAETGGRALTTMVQGYGGTPVQAGSILAAITQKATDPEMRVSAHGAGRFYMSMEEFFRRQQIPGYERDPMGQISYLRSHPEAATLFSRGGRELLAKEEEEAKAAGLDVKGQKEFESRWQTVVAIEEIVGLPGSKDQTWKWVEENLEFLKAGQEAIDYYDDQVRAMRQTYPSQTGRQVRGVQTTAETLAVRTAGGMKRSAEAALNIGYIGSQDPTKAFGMLGEAGFGMWGQMEAGLGWIGARTGGASREEAYRMMMEQAVADLRARGDVAGANELQRNMNEMLASYSHQQTRANYQQVVERATEARDQEESKVADRFSEEEEKTRQLMKELSQDQIEAYIATQSEKGETTRPSAPLPSKDVKRRVQTLLPLPRVGLGF